jgi:phthiodiolone/phenolphthiodiolone dimycocerosates ketoreductase
MDIELGMPGQIMPPVEGAIKNALRNEADGFDAVWWPDHLMGWFPDSLWTEDLTPLAKTQPNPHVHVDPLMMMGVAGAQMTRAKVGIVVTDLIRRNPSVLAQTMVTIDHLTKGRAILGLGSGEKLNITPYGMPFDKPVARLSEGIDILRLLWESEGKPVNFEGQFHKLENAVLGMAPYEGKSPPIWTAAHGPRMLELTGRKSDGWIPTKMSSAEYAEALGKIRQSSVDAGRDRDSVTPGLLAYVLVGPDEATVARLMEQPLVRALCVLLSADVFRSLGVEPPLQAAGSGWHDFIPTIVPREEALRIVNAIPPKVVDYYAFCGTPEQIVDQIAEQYDAGLRHLILWNITAFGDPELAGFSFRALGQIKDALRAR